MSVAAFKSARHPTAPPMSTEDYRRTRHVKRNLKLQRQIRDLVTAHGNCKYIGGNAAVEAIAATLGFEPHDLAIADVKIGKRIVTLICTPHRIWDNPLPAARSMDLKLEARTAGYHAILVPQAVVEREPRLGNAAVVARTAKDELRRRHADVARLSEDIVNKALVDMREQIDGLRVMSNVPSPIMSSETFVKFDRDLSRGFDMVRPEDGEVATIPDTEDYSAQVIDEETLASAEMPSTTTVTNVTFFTE